jgi:hypothetical protein
LESSNTLRATASSTNSIHAFVSVLEITWHIFNFVYI